MIKNITNKISINDTQVSTEPLSKRLFEELEERNEMDTCKNGYCSGWYVTT